MLTFCKPWYMLYRKTRGAYIMAKIDDRAIELWFKDLQSLQMIGDFFGVTRQAVKKWLNARGIDTGKWEVVCEGCGEVFWRHRYQIRKTRLNYCSSKCYYEALHNLGYTENRNGQREARRVVKEFFPLAEGHVVHHIDGNTLNNEVSNLMVFKDHSDHMRWHRAGGEDSGVIPVWPVLEKRGVKKVEKKAKPIKSDPFFRPMPKGGKSKKRG